MAERRESSSIHEDEILMPDDLLIEVLSLLPGKSLMRFKSVSKHWYSLIIHPCFVEMHQARSYARDGGAFLVNIPWSSSDILNLRRRFYVINVLNNVESARASIHHVWSLLPNKVKTRSNIFNGLLCFYDQGYWDIDRNIYLYNLTTREMLPLPATSTTMVRKRYFLGFDPANKEYKVLCVLKVECKYRSYGLMKSEVSTMGRKDGRWRPIGISHIFRRLTWKLPPKRCFSLDGVLYWIVTIYDKRFIVAFDVEHEKFEAIKYPPTEKVYNADATSLAHIQGHLSLVHLELSSGQQRWKVKITLWKLIDGKCYDKTLWTKQDITCQFPECYSRSFSCDCSGEVLSHRRLIGTEIPASEDCIDCYDLKTGKYKVRRITNHQDCVYDGFAFSPLLGVENIIPLKHL